MIVLILFPMVEKIQHDLEHFSDDHCSKKDIHFCKAEHTCSICDYVYSASATPPDSEERILVFSYVSISFDAALVFNTVISPKFVLSLRGPPSCV